MSFSIPAAPPLAADARALFDAALDAVRPDRLVATAPWDDLLDRPLAAYRRVAIAGAGKAALLMASGAELALAGRLTRDAGALAGAIAVPHGYPATLPPSARSPVGVLVREAGHPVPDAAGAAAAGEALALAESCGADDLLLVLLSGGGSALWPAFVPELSPNDARLTFGLLLASGADVGEINAVRKHLSRIAGGRLAAAAHPAEVLALVLSDVVGDDLSTIASGPTVADPTTFADAVDVLRRWRLWERVPAAVRAHLGRGLADAALETPKPGDPRLARARTVLVGSNRRALEAARDEAARRGYVPAIVSDRVTGEAREVGRALAARLLQAAADGPHPTCLLWGGETTVTVRGRGRGGRNQELALAAALALEALEPAGVRLDALLLSAGTDGVDGPTDAAGAWADRDTVSRARSSGVDARARLADNDAYGFFEAAGGLLRTGPTHTNVMDVQIGLTGTRRAGA